MNVNVGVDMKVVVNEVADLDVDRYVVEDIDVEADVNVDADVDLKCMASQEQAWRLDIARMMLGAMFRSWQAEVEDWTLERNKLKIRTRGWTARSKSEGWKLHV